MTILWVHYMGNGMTIHVKRTKCITSRYIKVRQRIVTPVGPKNESHHVTQCSGLSQVTCPSYLFLSSDQPNCLKRPSRSQCLHDLFQMLVFQFHFDSVVVAVLHVDHFSFYKYLINACLYFFQISLAYSQTAVVAF